MAYIRFPLNQGYVSGEHRSQLQDGELQRADGVYYKRHNGVALSNMKGRTTFGDTGSSAKVKGVHLATHDDGTARVLALSGTSLYSATAGTSGTFSVLQQAGADINDLSASTTHLSVVHAEDNHYIATGYDRNRTIEPDGTVRFMGMYAPQEPPTVAVAAAGGTASVPTATISSSGWTNPGNAWDGNDETFSNATLSASGTSTATWGTYASRSGGTRTVYIRWRLAGRAPVDPTTGDDGSLGIGGGFDSGYNVTVKIEKSEDQGATAYTTLLERTYTASTTQIQTTSAIVTANDDQVYIRATLTYNSGTSPASLRVYELPIKDGSDAANFSTDTGIYYALAELDQTRGLQSSIGPETPLTTFSTQNQATLTFPSSTQNTNTTHWLVYRTTDGGSVPQSLGLVATILSTESTWADDFEDSKDTQTFPLVPMLTIEGTVDEGTIRVPYDTPPPTLSWMASFKGRLVGGGVNNRRTLYGSITGRQESWPEINLIDSFSLPQNDQIVIGHEVGDVFVIWMKGATLTLTDFPEVLQGVFNAAQAIPMGGAPGCPSQNGAVAFSVHGESLGAWVSQWGVHVTNGHTWHTISDDLDWGAEVDTDNLNTAALAWDQGLQVLVLSVDTGGDGVTDRELWFHMAPKHRKSDGRPRITRGPTGRAAVQYSSGFVGQTHRRYSAHPSDGKVYLEESSTGEAGTIKWPQMFMGRDLSRVIEGVLHHTDWGTVNATVTVTAGRDVPGTSQTRAKTVSLSGDKRTEFHINRGGEWLEVQVTTPSGSTGDLIGLLMDIERMGEAGRKAS